MTDDKPTLEFVNDWGELERAVEALRPFIGLDYIDETLGYNDEFDGFMAALPVVVKYVPALLEQFSQLFELSESLTAAWEAFSKGLTPAGLVLPDYP